MLAVIPSPAFLQLTRLKVKIFADGANLDAMFQLYANPLIQGFTTNPTLMRQAGIDNYENFARKVVEKIPDRPISFEVFSDDFEEMQRQGRRIATWGDNVYVKIPVTNTRAQSTESVVRTLAQEGVHLNITALLTNEQVAEVGSWLAAAPHSYVSLFAGRIADTGRDPLPMVRQAVADLARYSHLELIWASPRELLNIFHAEETGCQVITVTHAMLDKLATVGKDLGAFSLETVQMFHRDAVSAGFSL